MAARVAVVVGAAVGVAGVYLLGRRGNDEAVGLRRGQVPNRSAQVGMMRR